MCGIVAMIARTASGFYYKDAEQFEKMLVINGTLRGKHSTGVFQVLKNRQAFLLKNAVDPHMYLCQDEWNNMRQRMINTARLMVGHGRHATQGSITTENAHPFYENNILLVHNGTLRGHKRLADTEVDSHAVCKAFSEKSAEEVIPTIDGAFAFVWYDIVKDKLYAIRNEERPLWLITTPSKYILTSEQWYVTGLLARDQEMMNNVKVEALAPGKLLEFGLSNEEVIETEIDLKKAAPTTGTGQVVTGTARTTPEVGETANEPGTRVIPFRQVETKSKPFTGALTTLYRNIDKAYKTNDVILIKIMHITAPGSESVRSAAYTGQVIHPGRPAVDVKGNLINVTPDQYKAYFSGPCIATVDRITYHQGGPIVHVLNTRLDTVVETWSGKISETELKHICDEEVCFGCTSILNPDYVSVMSFSRKAIGEKSEYRCYCPDCIEDRLSKSDNGEEHLEVFQGRRLAIQERLEISKESGASTHRALIVTGPGTTQ